MEHAAHVRDRQQSQQASQQLLTEAAEHGKAEGRQAEEGREGEEDDRGEGSSRRH